MEYKNTEKYNGQRLASFIFECFMAVLYVALSIMMLFASFIYNSVQEGSIRNICGKLLSINEVLRIIVGIVVGLYGLFRVYRAYVKITQRNE